REATAEAVGVGAIVFNYLYNSRIKDINFTIENALSFDGSTGPYAQYTYARTCSILEKAAGIPDADTEITMQEEADVLKVLSKFPERVLQAIEEYEPCVIARYVIDVCTAFNRFYRSCPILSVEEEATKALRLRITKAVNTVLASALHLICMKTPEKI
ncbi:MAG: arginine--tRNA ligase, partial [Clostridia bacterium]|nr:arginine--tRNA ligase [Clostridia bacterium]